MTQLSVKPQSVTFFCLKFKTTGLFDSSANDSSLIHKAKKYRDLSSAKVFRLKRARRFVEVSRFCQNAVSLSSILDNIEIVEVEADYFPTTIELDC